MKIGIISSSHYNVYGATLITKLLKLNRKPVVVLCPRRLRFAQLRKYMKRNGLLATLRKIGEVKGFGSVTGNKTRQQIYEYAMNNDLEDWTLELPELCARKGIELHACVDVNSPNTVDFVRKKEIDLLLNTGGQIIRPRLIKATAHGVLNAHMGKLPEYRGFNVLEWSLFYAQPIGVTLHYIDQGIDTGDMVQFRRIFVDKNDTIGSLRAKSFPTSIELMTWGIKHLEKGDLCRIPQEKSAGRQYFAMHPRLKAFAEKNIGKLSL
jgi:methionyl-tRNA formyltransferase